MSFVEYIPEILFANGTRQNEYYLNLKIIGPGENL